MDSTNDNRISSNELNNDSSTDIIPDTVAFILCYSTNLSFTPITNELPPCLFPLCNIPVLFYGIQWLYNNGIKKIYIICPESNKKPIQNFLNEIQEKLKIKSIEILVPNSNYSISCISDSIKWIHSSSSIPLNFKNSLILSGTIVTNIPLKSIIEKVDERSIVTTIFTKTKSNGYSAIVDDEGFLLQLSIPSMFDFDKKERSNIDRKSGELKVETGLNDSLIYIVTPEFMSIFSSNNFLGCNSIMNDCVPSLIDHEKDKKAVSAFILPDSFYSSDINDISNYINSSIEIIKHHLSPFSIDLNLLGPWQTYTHLYDDGDDDNAEEDEENNGNDNDNNNDNNNDDINNDDNNNNDDEKSSLNKTTYYHLEKDYVYIDQNAVVPSSINIDHCVIGCETTIENDCTIQNSTIGNNCKIGKDVIIKNSIIWDRVIIEDGAQINNSVISSDCTIKKDVKIDLGSLISFNVTVDINISPCRRLCSYEFTQNEIEFTEDESPDWLINYINNRKPLKESEDGGYFEFKPSPEAETHLLNLWYLVSPSTFPIDTSKIRNTESEDENDDEN